MNRFGRPAAPATLVLALVLTGGCGSTDAPDRDRLPRVLATTTMIAEAADRLAGACAEVNGLLPVGGDPHVYEPVPRDVRMIVRSDLVLYNGFGLEAWLDRLVRNAGGTRPVVEVADGLTPIYGVYQEGRDPDPHLWGNVEHFSHYVGRIADALAELVPGCEADIREREQAYRALLRELHVWVGERTATIPEENRHLVTSHDAFQYFADAYGLAVLGSPIGISTDEQPSARTVARIIDDVRRTGIPAIFVETTINPNVIERIARETGAEIGGELYSDSLGEEGSGADSYVGMIVHNTRTVVRALGGEDGVFEAGSERWEGALP